VRDAAVSFDDHFSQARLFWLSMSPTEREHIVAAYTFELDKCRETAVKERALKVLADIDPELCAQVAAGLGLPVPEASLPPAAVEPSPALSQLGGDWPVEGRIIGIVTSGADDLDGVREVRRAVLDAGMVPLVVAPAGGVLDREGDPVTVQRTFATARSTEFDAIVPAGAPAPAADAYGARDAKADDDLGVATVVDARLLLMVTEAYRHGKAIGAWGEGGVALGGRPARGPHGGGVRRDSGLGAAGRDTPARGTPCLGPSHRYL
jgi:catalase